MMDVNPPLLQTITVLGALQFDVSKNISLELHALNESKNISLELHAVNIIVRGGANFLVGTEEAPFGANSTYGEDVTASIVLHGDRYATPLLLGQKDYGAKSLIDYGAKSLIVFGTLEMHGAARQSANWAMLNASVAAGGTELTLDSFVDWHVGDLLVIAPSGFEPSQAETHRIEHIDSWAEDRGGSQEGGSQDPSNDDYDSAVTGQSYASSNPTNALAPHLLGRRSGRTELRLSSPLLFARKSEVFNHDPAGDEGADVGASRAPRVLDMRVEVGLLTRSVIVRSATLEEDAGLFTPVWDSEMGARVHVDTLVYTESAPEDAPPELDYPSVGIAHVSNVAFELAGHAGYKERAAMQFTAAPVGTTAQAILAEKIAVLQEWRLPSFVRGCSFDTSFGSAIAVGERVANVTVEANVIHWTLGSSIYINGLGALVRSNLVVRAATLLQHNGRETRANIRFVRWERYVGGIEVGVSATGKDHQIVRDGINAEPRLHLSSSAVADSRVGVFLSLCGPPSKSHAFSTPAKAVVMRRVLSVGMSPLADCHAPVPVNRDPHAFAVGTSYLGIEISSFASNFIAILPEKKSWAKVPGSYPALYGRSELRHVTFARWSNELASGCPQGAMAAIRTSEMGSDAVHPMSARVVAWLESEEDGTLWRAGAGATVLARAEYQSPVRADGVTLTGYMLPPRYAGSSDYAGGAVTYGLYRAGCESRSASWNAHLCPGSLDRRYLQLVIESMDGDTETRSLVPVALTNLEDDTVDLMNGGQDHGWCFGYTCLKRLSTFFAIVAGGSRNRVDFTGTPPGTVRFHTLGYGAHPPSLASSVADNSGRLTVKMTYTTAQKHKVYLGGIFVQDANVAADGTPYFSLAGFQDRPNVVPAPSDVCGTNAFDYNKKELEFTLFRLGLGLDISIENFYAGDLIRNLAALLQIPPSRIRVVSIVGGSVEVTLTIEQADPCADVDCGEEGECDDGQCACHDGYTGSACERMLCHASCEQCDPPGSLDASACTVCAASTPFFLAGRCLGACPAAHVPVANTCTPCSPTCGAAGTCTGPGSAQCTSCTLASRPYVLLATDAISGLPLPDLPGRCVSEAECPYGTFPDRVSRVCTSCAPGCRECTGGSSSATDISSLLKVSSL
ncbi:hypothetical protein T492DRAFT_832763 [Pavlovales sp. CCMP2436]|nr:hypothetical protein T492DRAFT_832763 [Pavlovales sp. CCMP2436]